VLLRGLVLPGGQTIRLEPVIRSDLRVSVRGETWERTEKLNSKRTREEEEVRRRRRRRIRRRKGRGRERQNMLKQSFHWLPPL